MIGPELLFVAYVAAVPTTAVIVAIIERVKDWLHGNK